jgi:Tol biopolymer transport system component
MAENEDIYVMNADGSDIVRLTANDVYDRKPAWSPDGQYIVYQQSIGARYHIYRMRADGTEQVRLSTTSDHDRSPDWR